MWRPEVAFIDEQANIWIQFYAGFVEGYLFTDGTKVIRAMDFDLDVQMLGIL